MPSSGDRSSQVQQLLREAAILGRHGNFDEAERRYRSIQQLLRRAHDPDAHYNFGVVLQGLKRYEDALDQFQKSLALRPGADALTNIGVCQQILGRHAQALDSCRGALALDHNLPEAHNMAGNALQSLGQHEEAIAHYEKAIAKRPDFAIAHINLGNALEALRRHDEAVLSYQRAQQFSPDESGGDYYEAVARLRMGDYREGWRKYEGRWRCNDFPTAVRKLPQPLWLGREDLTAKTILLHAEQGLGDTIQFVRYASMVAALGARVILEVNPSLVPLMGRIEGVSQVISSKETARGFDYHCPLMSLPLAFGTTVESVPATIPYVTVSAEAAAAWRGRLAQGSERLVGVAWSGNAKHDHSGSRDMVLEHLAPLFGVPGVRFVSLQKQLHEREQHWLAKHPNVVHIGETFAHTAELIAGLDLVVSVDTAWVHWAGAIGKPVWVILAHEPQCDWRWMLDRQDSPWYPTARLLRQTAQGEWSHVIERAAQTLASFVAR